jgi:hypothetical protein
MNPCPLSAGWAGVEHVLFQKPLRTFWEHALAVSEEEMSKLSIALFVVSIGAGVMLPVQTQARIIRECCRDVVAPPLQCLPVLRVSPAVYGAEPPYPPHPVPYSVWYYSLWEPHCAGKPAAACPSACIPVAAEGVAVRAGY